MKKCITVLYIIALIALFSVACVASVLPSEFAGPLLGAESFENGRDEHLEYIRAELERYERSDKYFEKYAISIQLREYIEENVADVSAADIAALVKLNEEHIADLLSKEDEYDAMLKYNGVLFVEKCEEIEKADDYASIKQACDVARFYLLNMDVSDRSVQDAILIYESNIKVLEQMENNARIFIEHVKVVENAKESDNILSLILIADAARGSADPGVVGVEEAMLALESAMRDYNSSVANYNVELAETRKAAANIAGCKGVEGFINFILEVIG